MTSTTAKTFQLYSVVPAPEEHHFLLHLTLEVLHKQSRAQTSLRCPAGKACDWQMGSQVGKPAWWGSQGGNQGLGNPPAVSADHTSASKAHNLHGPRCNVYKYQARQRHTAKWVLSRVPLELQAPLLEYTRRWYWRLRACARSMGAHDWQCNRSICIRWISVQQRCRMVLHKIC